jgi:class 3 adenylate cyclase/alpha-beta hydrolase superfamily lysophospholipase
MARQQEGRQGRGWERPANPAPYPTSSRQFRPVCSQLIEQDPNFFRAPLSTRGKTDAVLEVPEVRYVETPEGAYLAYQTFGDGSLDLVLSMNGGVALELAWEEPAISAALRHLASFSRVIAFDCRGFGSSWRVDAKAVPAVQTWSDDIGTVMTAGDRKSAALFAWGEATPAAMLFAATYPDRVTSMVLVNPFARYIQSDDCPWGMPENLIKAYGAALRELWGTGGMAATVAPSLMQSEADGRRWARMERLSASPDAVEAAVMSVWRSDVTDVLSAIRSPTLVISRVGDRHVRYQHGGYVASRIPGATLVELPGDDHLPFAGDAERLLNEAQDFITGSRLVPVLDRVLATVLFTDIVGSTSHAAQLGDRRWRETLNRYDEIVLHNLERFRGKRVKGTGDGTLATFDGPARAVECARSIAHSIREDLRFSIRAGIHTGEIETRGDDVAGMAVHIAARVAELAGADEVVTSSTVKDLVVGSGIEFGDRGDHELKGVPGSWRLFAVKD